MTQNKTPNTRSELRDFVRAKVAEQLGLEQDAFTDEDSLVELGADSLDGVELVMAFEDELEIDIEDDAELDEFERMGVKQLVERLAGHLELTV